MSQNNLLGNEWGIVFYSSLLYTKLTENGDDRNYYNSYGLVKNWQTKFDPFAQNMLMIPINSSLHWSLCVVVRPNSLLLLIIPGSAARCELFLLDPLGDYHDIEVIGRYVKQNLLSTWLDERNRTRRDEFQNEVAMRVAIAVSSRHSG